MPNDFPNDITIDILLKLPVKSLLRFKKVDKSWCSLIEDRQFIKQCYYQKIFVVLWKDKCFSIDAPLQHDSGISIIKPPQEINYPLSKIFVNSCNGLFLLVLPRPNKIVWREPTLKQSDKIILWNPALRQSRTILCPIHTTNRRGFRLWDRPSASYVLGYDSSLEDYKIVSITHGHGDKLVQIFSTKSNSWKLIGDLPKNNSSICGVVVDGIAYLGMGKQFILGLCLKDENFEEILLPDPDMTSYNTTLHTAGGCLLAFRTNSLPNGMVDNKVWCMKKNEMSYSWSKTLAITVPITRRITWHYNRGGRLLVLVGFTEDGDMVFLVKKDEIEFLVYDSKTAKCKQVKVGGDEASRKFKGIKITGPHASVLINFGVTYMGTLISPNAI